MNRIKTVLLCVFASFVISGFLNPIGLISGPVAESYGIPVTVAVARFGYFTVGVFAGYILSFYIYDYIKLKSVVVAGYGLIATPVGWVDATPGTVERSMPFKVGIRMNPRPSSLPAGAGRAPGGG